MLPKNVWQYVVQIPRMAALGKKYVLQGGTQYNLAAVKAQVDYIKERGPGAEVYVHPHCGEAGAIGAAFETLRIVKRRGYSTFVGLDQAIVRLVRIDAVALVVVDVVRGAPPEADEQPPSADVVDQRHLLGHADRMMERHLRDREPDVDALGAAGERRGECHRIDVGADAVEVVLGEPQHLHPELVAKLRFTQRFLDDPVILIRLHRGGEEEVAEFHVCPSVAVRR